MQEINTKELCNILKIFMTTNNLSQADVSKKIGVNQATISRILNCKNIHYTKSMEKVFEHAKMQNLVSSDLSLKINRSIKTYLDAGGSLETLCQIIDTLAMDKVNR